MRYNLVQYSNIQYNTMPYKTAYAGNKYHIWAIDTVQYNKIQCKSIQYCVTQTVPYHKSTVQFNTAYADTTMQYNAIQYNTATRSTVRYKTIQDNRAQLLCAACGLYRVTNLLCLAQKRGRTTLPATNLCHPCNGTGCWA